MRPGLRPGTAVEHRAVVRSWMKPHLDGLVQHKLYASWAMVYHMEVAARKLLAPFLEAGEEAVGAALTLDHLAPAGIGEAVRVRCVLSRRQKNRIYSRIEAYAHGKMIGRGSHIQAVMTKERFAKLTRVRKETRHR